MNKHRWFYITLVVVGMSSASLQAKLTIGTVVPVVSGVTTIIVNGSAILDSIKHPKKTAAKVKKAIKGK